MLIASVSNDVGVCFAVFCSTGLIISWFIADVGALGARQGLRPCMQPCLEPVRHDSLANNATIRPSPSHMYAVSLRDIQILVFILVGSFAEFSVRIIIVHAAWNLSFWTKIIVRFCLYVVFWQGLINLCGKKFGWSRVRWPFFKQNLKVYFYGVWYSVSMFECSEISVSELDGEGANRTFCP